MNPSLIVLGRFQPFHNGHASMIEAALELGQGLRICIGSSEAEQSLDNPWITFGLPLDSRLIAFGSPLDSSCIALG